MKKCKICGIEKSLDEFYRYSRNKSRIEPNCKECKNKRRINDEWRGWKKGWKYDGDIDDPVYLQERAELFKENGNGWWYFPDPEVSEFIKTGNRTRNEKQ